MASTRRKSAAIALAVVGVAGLSLASAAQLNVNSASLGAGSSVVASCDTDGIATAFSNAYASTGYNVTSVNLSGVADTCNGLKYQAQLLTGPVGTQTTLGPELSGPLAVAAGAASLPLTPAQPAAAVTGVSVVIYG